MITYPYLLLKYEIAMKLLIYLFISDLVGFSEIILALSFISFMGQFLFFLVLCLSFNLFNPTNCFVNQIMPKNLMLLHLLNGIEDW